MVVGSSGSSSPTPSPGVVVDEVEEVVPPGRVVVGPVVVVELRPRPSGEVGGGVASVRRGKVVVEAGRRSGAVVVVVTGTLAAGTSSVGGGGSGRTTR